MTPLCNMVVIVVIIAIVMLLMNVEGRHIGKSKELKKYVKEMAG